MRHTKETVGEREAATRQAEEEAADAQCAVEEARRAVEEARAMRDAKAQAEVSEQVDQNYVIYRIILHTEGHALISEG